MRESGQGQLGGPAAPAGLTRALEYLYPQAGAGQCQRSGKAVGPGPDHDGVGPGHRHITSPSATRPTGTALSRNPAAS